MPYSSYLKQTLHFELENIRESIVNAGLPFTEKYSCPGNKPMIIKSRFRHHGKITKVHIGILHDADIRIIVSALFIGRVLHGVAASALISTKFRTHLPSILKWLTMHWQVKLLDNKQVNHW